MSRATERRRHEALARETGSWQSWAVGNWWTNRNIAIEMAEPFTVPHMRLDFECMCDDTGRHTHQYDLTRHCVFVDHYESDAEVGTRLKKILGHAQRMAARGATPLVIGDELMESEVHPGLLIAQARVRGDDAPRAWVALNNTYVEAVRKHALPGVTWLLVGYPRGVPVGTEISTSESPMVIGVRGDHLVAVVMPMANNDSAIGIAEGPAEVQA